VNPRTWSSVKELPKSKLKSVFADEAHGRLQPSLSLYACSLVSGARETSSRVMSPA